MMLFQPIQIRVIVTLFFKLSCSYRLLNNNNLEKIEKDLFDGLKALTHLWV